METEAVVIYADQLRIVGYGTVEYCKKIAEGLNTKYGYPLAVVDMSKTSKPYKDDPITCLEVGEIVQVFERKEVK